MKDYYLKIGKAIDLKNKKEQLLYRALEVLPAFLSFSTLFLLFFLSFKIPFWVAVFVILFDLIWLLRVIYRCFLLMSGYKRMERNIKIDWIKKLKKIPLPHPLLPEVKSWKDIYHLIIFPSYKEPVEILKESFKALLKTDYPKEKMIVVLALEERAGKKAKEIAKEIKKEFGNKFFKFLVTFHPKNLPGEIAGKGANEVFATKEAKRKIIDPLKIPPENIILSSFDADTCVFPKYFSCLTYYYLKAKNPFRKSYQPIPLFLNNIWEVPLFSRVFSFSSTFWNTMNQASPENLVTFSSHSMSFKTVLEIGHKQKNVVSDDSRIFWNCFLKFNGNYKTQPLYYPVSMDALAAKSYLQTIKNIYKQQRRWAYGAENIPYVLFGFLKNKKIPLKKKITAGFDLLEGFWSWATASLIIFILGWLPLVVGGAQFNQTLLSYNLPRMARNLMSLAMIGIVFSAYFTILLLPKRPKEKGKLKIIAMALEWILVPFIMIFIQPLPALDAQLRLAFGKYMGFWPTEKIRKNYSK